MTRKQKIGLLILLSTNAFIIARNIYLVGKLTGEPVTIQSVTALSFMGYLPKQHSNNCTGINFRASMKISSRDVAAVERIFLRSGKDACNVVKRDTICDGGCIPVMVETEENEVGP